MTLINELNKLQRQPHLLNAWIDSSRGRSRLCLLAEGRYVNGDQRKRRMQLQAGELHSVLLKIEVGKKIIALQKRIKQLDKQIQKLEDYASKIIE